MDLQENEMSCGKACVREALRMFWPRFFKDLIPVLSDCRDFFALKCELEKNGVKAEAYGDVTKAKLSETKTPAVLQMEDGERFHFVLLKSVRKEKAVIYDPAHGEFKAGIDEAFEGFTGNVLYLKLGEKPEKKTKFHSTDLISPQTKFILAFLALLRGFTSFLFFAMISSSEHAIGSLFPLAVFLISLVLTLVFTSHENSVFGKKRILPLLSDRSETSSFFEAMKAHGESIGFYETFWDCLSFLLLSLFVFCLQDILTIALFAGSIFLFFACEWFLKKNLSRIYSLTSFREARLRKTDSHGRTIEQDYQTAQKTGRIYISLWALGRFITLAMVSVALIGFFTVMENPSASDFVSDAFLIFGSGFAIIKIMALPDRFSSVRQRLYLLDPQILNSLQKQNGKKSKFGRKARI